MALKKSETIASPVGRLVMGSVYQPRTTNDKGEPLVYKTGANKGQPRSEYFIALAIKKGAEIQQPHGHLNWVHTPWGAVIYKAGTDFLAHAPQLPSFAWKVADGDSTVPNKKGRRNCDTEGFPGHWVLFFSGSLAPKLCDSKGVQTPEMQVPGAIKNGYYVQVGFNAVGNESTESPGVYLNHLAVSFAGFGPEIQSGIDTQSIGFGNAALPEGASATPIGGMQLAQALPGATPPLPGVGIPPPVQPAALPGPSLMPTAVAQLPGAAVAPNAAFLQVAPPMPALALPALATPAAPAFRMGPAAGTHTYEQWRASYTDEQLLAAGVIVR